MKPTFGRVLIFASTLLATAVFVVFLFRGSDIDALRFPTSLHSEGLHPGILHTGDIDADGPLSDDIQSNDTQSGNSTEPKGPKRKPPLPAVIPVEDNFPLAVGANTPEILPPIPAWNVIEHVSEPTPLFIGFTRNWLVLQQAVVSYITSGWPPEDIYVVDNTGTFQSNKRGNLSLQNPFYLDYQRLTGAFGVNVLTAPTLLSFAQLQNYFLATALENDWPHYFWSHQDVLALPDERQRPFQSLYHRAVKVLKDTIAPGFGKWGIRFFAYDRLALVNVEAYSAVGAWDTFIPFYGTDCDMHERLAMEGYEMTDAFVGYIYDMGFTLPDLRVLYREDSPANRELCPEGTSEDQLAYGLGDCRYEALIRTSDDLQHRKMTHEGGRNFWQGQQMGGQGEPFYKDPLGFEAAIQMTIEYGRDILSEKWGHQGCNIRGSSLEIDDQWRVEHDEGFRVPGNRPYHGCPAVNEPTPPDAEDEPAE